MSRSLDNSPQPSVLHWFRLALRTHDNISLNYALHRAADQRLPLYPVFLLEPSFYRPGRIAALRMQLIIDALHELDSKLRTHGSRLLVLRGGEHDLLAKIDAWHVGEVVWEEESAPESRQRDARIAAALRDKDVFFTEKDGHMLLSTWKLDQALGADKMPLTMRGFLGLAEKAGMPDRPVGMNSWYGVASMPDQVMNSEDYRIPAIADLGFELPPDHGVSPRQRFKGGEDTALEMMEKFLVREGGKVVATFEKPMTNPAAFSPRETTALSPYLSHGMLSPRLLFWKVKDIEARYKKHTQPPVSLIGQLMWREFTHFLGRRVDNFFQMEGNPVCRQIRWDVDDNAEERFKAWAEARTGHPWIDALVIQLKTEGWVHHLGRHSIACFLTRGDLWVHWESGQRVFEEYLIDHDPCINAFSWMWMSCSAFFHKFFRVYGPRSFPEKRDKNGDFVRHYLPVLKDMPAKYIYEPWKAPIDVQKKANCIVGTDYPNPMIDHAVASKENIARMKTAFNENKEVAKSTKKEQKTSIRNKDWGRIYGSMSKPRKIIKRRSRR